MVRYYQAWVEEANPDEDFDAGSDSDESEGSEEDMWRTREGGSNSDDDWTSDTTLNRIASRAGIPKIPEKIPESSSEGEEASSSEESRGGTSSDDEESTSTEGDYTESEESESDGEDDGIFPSRAVSKLMQPPANASKPKPIGVSAFFRRPSESDSDSASSSTSSGNDSDVSESDHETEGALGSPSVANSPAKAPAAKPPTQPVKIAKKSAHGSQSDSTLTRTATDYDDTEPSIAVGRVDGAAKHAQGLDSEDTTTMTGTKSRNENAGQKPKHILYIQVRFSTLPLIPLSLSSEYLQIHKAFGF